MTSIFCVTGGRFKSLGKKLNCSVSLQLWSEEQEIECLRRELSAVAATKAFLDSELSAVNDSVSDLELGNLELRRCTL